MKKLIVTLLTITMVFTLFTGCIDDIADEFGFSNHETHETPKILDKTQIDTCSLCNYRVTYVFTIRVEGERITNIYRATVSYNYKSVWGSENEYEYRYDSCEIALQGPA